MTDKWEIDLIEELKDTQFAKAYGASRAKSGFGIALFKARQAINMTQKALSEKIGSSQPYIAKLESGEANPTLGAAGGVLAVLGRRLVVDTAPLIPEIPRFSASAAIGITLNNDPTNLSFPPLQSAASTVVITPIQQADWVYTVASALDPNNVDLTVPIWSIESNRERVLEGAMA